MEQYITRGIHNTIPPRIQALLWRMVEDRDESQQHPSKDYFNVFIFHQEAHTLHVKHQQERPKYENTITITVIDTYSLPKVYVIREDDIDFSYYVMLLPEEY